MITDLMQVARILNSCLIELYEDGEIAPDEHGDLKPEQVYPFQVSELAAVHTHKTGAGDGVWFRLKDGRVFDKRGEEQQADPALYDTVDN